MKNDGAIRTAALTKVYAGGKGCFDITLTVERGCAFGLLGPNGAGKSTFVKMLVGLIRPTGGEAELLGLPLGAVAARRRIGYLPELYRYQDWLSGEEVLMLHANLCGLDPHEARRRSKRLLAEVGLAGRGQERVRRYSKGMQQRLGIAAALIGDPELLFLDEPSSALDPLGRHEVKELLRRLKAEGRTIFLNTHLLEDVESICDEVALLAEGRILAAGKLQELLAEQLTWRLRIGGATPEAVALMVEEAGLPIRLLTWDAAGGALLDCAVAHEDQIGWLHALVVEHGFTLYESQPVRRKLDDWFMQKLEGERA